MEVVQADEHVKSSPGDTIPANRRPKLRYDHLKIWIPLYDDRIGGSESDEWKKDARARARADAARAHHLFNTSRCGVAFESDIDEKEISDSGLLYQTCETTQALKDAVGADYNALNVYYVMEVGDGLKGAFCKDTGVLLVARPSDNETLAHEIGHAFSLEDVELESDENNVMTNGSYTRTGATLGQCFRCNLDERSLLLRNQRGPQRKCDDYESNDDCPEIAWPNGVGGEPLSRTTSSGVSPLRRWADCEECAAQELQAFIKMPLNEAQVRQAWQSEPTGQERHLDRTYTELRNYGATYPEARITLSRKDYIERYRRSALYRYQLRLAIGLLRMRTQPASRLFDELIETALPEVKITVQKLLM